MRGDLFLPGLRLAISKQPCLRGKPFSRLSHYSVLYSSVSGGAGHCSTPQSCQASAEGLCIIFMHACRCICMHSAREGFEGEPGALRIRQRDPWVGGQSSSSSPQTIENSSESNWAVCDSGLSGVGCSSCLPPSCSHLCFPRQFSPSPFCVLMLSLIICSNCDQMQR